MWSGLIDSNNEKNKRLQTTAMYQLLNMNDIISRLMSNIFFSSYYYFRWEFTTHYCSNKLQVTVEIKTRCPAVIMTCSLASQRLGGHQCKHTNLRYSDLASDNRAEQKFNKNPRFSIHKAIADLSASNKCYDCYLGSPLR